MACKGKNEQIDDLVIGGGEDIECGSVTGDMMFGEMSDLGSGDVGHVEGSIDIDIQHVNCGKFSGDGDGRVGGEREDYVDGRDIVENMEGMLKVDDEELDAVQVWDVKELGSGDVGDVDKGFGSDVENKKDAVCSSDCNANIGGVKQCDGEDRGGVVKSPDILHISDEELEAARVRDANELLDEALKPPIRRMKDLFFILMEEGKLPDPVADVRCAISDGAEVTDHRMVRGVKRNDVEIIEWLLVGGGNPNAVDKRGNTALMVLSEAVPGGVAWSENPNVAYMRMVQGFTPSWEMHIRALMRNLNMLLDAGASVNTHGCNGRTALINICKYQVGLGDGVVELLLDNGANVNAGDDDGMTALMYAVKYNDTQVVGRLLSCGADVNRRNHGGCGMADFIPVFCGCKVAIVLMRGGADISGFEVDSDEQCTDEEFRLLKQDWEEKKLDLYHLCREVIRMCVMRNSPGIHVKYLVMKLKLPEMVENYVADMFRFDV